MTCVETFATLRIFSKDIEPDIIENRLGLLATKMIPIDPNSRYRPRRESHLWSWTTEGIIDSTDNVEHINAILQLLEGKESLLSELRKDGCATDIFCFWISSGQGGPFLELKTMESLLKFGLEISWDIYFDDENEK
jgi:hypothetical protein